MPVIPQFGRVRIGPSGRAWIGSELTPRRAQFRVGTGVVLYTYIAARPGTASSGSSSPYQTSKLAVWTPGNRPERAKMSKNVEFQEKCQFRSKSAKTAQTGQFGRPKRPENGRFGPQNDPVSSGNWPKVPVSTVSGRLEPLWVTLGYPRNPKVTLKGYQPFRHFLGVWTGSG
jgi:hypothetical protein